MKLNKLVAVDNTGVEDFVGDDLKALCDDLVFYKDYPQEPCEIIRRMAGAEGMLVSWHTPITAEIIKALPDLKYIGMCCSLFDEKSSNVDISAARAHDVHVVGVKDYGDEGVVEFIVSSLIQTLKNQGPEKFRDEPIEMGGLKVGIIGLGTLGTMVGQALSHFGMEVYYHSRHEKETAFTYLAKDDLLETCDVITCHLPRHTKVLDQEAFERLGQHTILINTGLSPSYDEKAFLDWITLPKRFAIFDSVSLTPELSEAYKAYNNIHVSDHVTGFTWNARKRLAQKAYGNLQDFLRRQL